MTKKQYKQLETKIKKTLALNQLEDVVPEIKSLLKQKRLSQKEYNLLLQTQRKQLKIILDLNLLPDYEFITRRSNNINSN